MHEVYLSGSSEAVADGTALVDTVADNSYAPTELEFGLDYYWKIVEVNEAEAIGSWAGEIWMFRTEEYLVIDDFESYDDEESRIFDTWLDGFVNGTGSTVGYLAEPFAEQTTVHSGKQAMPLFYENVGGIADAEVELALEPAQDWTQAGVTTLAVYFYGDLDNDAAAVYVKINGTKVTGGGSTALALWQQWNIDLAATAEQLREDLLAITQDDEVDLAFQEDNLYRRNRRLIDLETQPRPPRSTTRSGTCWWASC